VVLGHTIERSEAGKCLGKGQRPLPNFIGEVGSPLLNFVPLPWASEACPRRFSHSKGKATCEPPFPPPLSIRIKFLNILKTNPLNLIGCDFLYHLTRYSISSVPIAIFQRGGEAIGVFHGPCPYQWGVLFTVPNPKSVSNHVFFSNKPLLNIWVHGLRTPNVMRSLNPIVSSCQS